MPSPLTPAPFLCFCPIITRSCLLVFVVGGISPSEVREVRAELEAAVGERPTVLLGGTSLLSPADVCRQMLA